MSKRTLSMKKQSRRITASMLEGLEDRRLMSVTPTAIADATVNDTVFDANTSTLHVVYYDTAAHQVKFQSFGTDGSVSPVETVDASGDAGQFMSLAEDGNGVMHVAYY